MGNVLRLNSHKQNGFAGMYIMIFGLVLSIVVMSLITQLQNQSKMQAQLQSKNEIINFKTALLMIFSNPVTCKANLVGSAFGTSVSELTSLSSAGNIKVLFPISAGPENGVMLSTSKSYYQIAAKKIYFKPLKPAIQTGPTYKNYVADLIIETSTQASSLSHIISVPFYLVSNGSDTLTDCYATSYTEQNDVDPTTIEDALCQQTVGPTAKYNPRDHICI